MLNLSGALMDNGLMARLLKMRVAFRLRQLSRLRRGYGIERWQFPEVYLLVGTARSEVTEAGAYRRQGPIVFELDDKQGCRNASDIWFTYATTDWLPRLITHVGLASSPKHGEGDVLFSARIVAPVRVCQGDRLGFVAGDIAVFPDGEES